jgi:uncharacterized phage-like protein YoqJ
MPRSLLTRTYRKISANTHFEKWWFKTFYKNTAEAAYLHKLHSVSFQWKLAFLFIRIGVEITLKRLVVTGYKQHELGIFDEKHPGIDYIKKAIRSRFIDLLDVGLEWVIVSGQLGVEAWAVEVVIELKELYPELKYAVITPFLEQEKNWNDTNKMKYNEIIANADYHVSLTSTPYEAPWQFVEKNKFFLRNADGMLILYDSENEGSPKFIKEAADKFAESTDYQVLTITPDDLNTIAEEEQMKNWY